MEKASPRPDRREKVDADCDSLFTSHPPIEHKLYINAHG